MDREKVRAWSVVLRHAIREDNLAIEVGDPPARRARHLHAVTARLSREMRDALEEDRLCVIANVAGKNRS
jgi:hypothetical protein